MVKFAPDAPYRKRYPQGVGVAMPRPLLNIGLTDEQYEPPKEAAAAAGVTVTTFCAGTNLEAILGGTRGRIPGFAFPTWLFAMVALPGAAHRPGGSPEKARRWP